MFLSCKQHVVHVGHGLVTKIDFFFFPRKGYFIHQINIVNTTYSSEVAPCSTDHIPVSDLVLELRCT